MLPSQLESTPEIEIRPATASDVTAIADIDAQTRGQARLDLWQERLAPFVSAPETASRQLCRVATVGGRVVGFVVAEVRSEEFDLPTCGWILVIGVAEGARGREVGRRLVNRVVDDMVAQGVTSVRTMVAWDNSELTSFFGSLGFDCGPYLQLEKRVGEARPSG